MKAAERKPKFKQCSLEKLRSLLQQKNSSAEESNAKEKKVFNYEYIKDIMTMPDKPEYLKK